MENLHLSRLDELLWPTGFRRNVWMILDGARDPRVFAMLLNSYLDYSCLYSGPIPPALEKAAPYLVLLEHGGYYTRQLLARAWGNNWGVILRCDLDLERLRKHLRKFLMVRDTSGRNLVFRYYDPRVLRTFLPTCGGRELEEFFGPIDAFYLEDSDARSAWEFHREGAHLKREKLALVPLAAASS